MSLFQEESLCKADKCPATNSLPVAVTAAGGTTQLEEGMMTATGADVTRVTEDYLALIWKACEWPDDGRRPNTTDLAAALEELRHPRA